MIYEDRTLLSQISQMHKPEKKLHFYSMVMNTGHISYGILWKIIKAGSFLEKVLHGHKVSSTNTTLKKSFLMIKIC